MGEFLKISVFFSGSEAGFRDNIHFFNKYPLATPVKACSGTGCTVGTEVNDLPSWNLQSRRMPLFLEGQWLVGLRQAGRFSFSRNRQGTCLEWSAG